MQIRYLLPTCLTLLLLAGCGNKGPIRPFQQKLPGAVKSAKLLQRGVGFQLQWKLPQRNQDGSALSDLDSVNVERLFSTESEFCAECRDPWPLIARVHPDLPAPAQSVGALFLLSDSGAILGQTARYRLQARNRLGDLGQSLILKQDFRQPVAAPTGLSITAYDRSIVLHWQPTAIPAGAGLVGYQIYRREGDKPFRPLALNLRPIEKVEFSDYGLQNSRTYYYRVRSLFNFAGQMLESLPSVEISARPTAG